TLIKIDGAPEELKPGMTAEIEILVSRKKGALQVPVQCVVERGGKYRAYVKAASGIEGREVVLGGTNDTVIEAVDGLKEGELVLLNPRADVPDSTERVVVEAEADADVDKRFGASQAKPSPAGAAPGGAAPAGAAAGGAAPGGAAASSAGGPAAGTTAGQPAGGAAAGGGAPGGAGALGGFKLPTFKDLDKNGDGKVTRE